MPLSDHLRSFLDSHQANFTLTTHPKAFTAREVAAAEHLPPRELAKTVVAFGDGRYHLIVIPASKVVDFHELRTALGLSQARLATETEVAELFPDCELGAMPPIGPYTDYKCTWTGVWRARRRSLSMPEPTAKYFTCGQWNSDALFCPTLPQLRASLRRLTAGDVLAGDCVCSQES
jgi:prolyl-tRNA editing enzyme YbaK/EbsC (Cys-tRNA(Pro) deacylase)